EKYSQENQKDLEILFALAGAYEEKGEKDKAKSIYERILNISPDNARAKEALNRIKASSH
ncbi:MAG: tetratricopeptide repeat protein, partial [bacterium]